MDIKILHKKQFPKELREIPDAPELLYYRGNLDALEHFPKIAVVGTRRCSEYGREATAKIAGELAKAGVCIVSGMARGIDTYAHKAALENGASTIAVLGSPINEKEIYPQRNKKLANDIVASGGLILSQYPTGTPSYPANFPERNRIVAGLSQGTLVVESPLKGGSMITASLANNYNRDVYAVPGSMFSRLSEGCNFWISQGAKIATAAKDILQDLEFTYKINFNGKNTEKLAQNEKLVYNLIAEAPQDLHIDKISQQANIDMAELSLVITNLIMQDFIKETEPNSYIAIT